MKSRQTDGENPSRAESIKCSTYLWKNICPIFSVGEHRGREISVAGVGKERDYRLSFILWTAGEQGRREDRRSGRDADEHTLLAGDLLSGRERVLVADCKYLVDNVHIEYIRSESGAYALQFVRAGDALCQER